MSNFEKSLKNKLEEKTEIKDVNDKKDAKDADEVLYKIQQQALPIPKEGEERSDKKITLSERDAKKNLVDNFERNNFEISDAFQKAGIGIMNKEKINSVVSDFSVREAAAQAVVRAVESGTISFNNFFDFNRYLFPEIKNDIDIQDIVVKKIVEYARNGDFFRFRELFYNFFKPEENIGEQKQVVDALKLGLLKKLDDPIFPGVINKYDDVIPNALRLDKDIAQKTKEVIAKLSKDRQNLNKIKIIKNFFSII